uniref:RNA-directed RNA polymerase n=1 Tax=Erysiphe necator associated tombus-like virus 10 TaxID=2744814 RepID=A0A8E3YZD3_9TOMB|nr:replicase region RdRP [Erysiphe necator associated tombus-like virus 10]
MSPPRQIYAFNSSLQNLVTGVKERVFYVKNEHGEFVRPPQALPDVFETRLSGVRKRILGRCHYVSPVERASYPLLYTGKKRIVYQDAAETLRWRNLCARDFQVTIFTKTERTLKPNAVARIVSPMSPEANLETGRFVKPMEHPILEAIADVAGHTVVMKGKNASQVGTCLAQHWEDMGGTGDCVAIGLDASRFDQHVGEQALAFEHTHYPPLLQSPKDRKTLRWLLSKQLNTKAFGRTKDGTVKYDVEGTRLSGVINTGLGNCILASEMCIAYCEEKSIRFRLANNGDDCVLFIHRKDLTRFSTGLKEWFRDMGFTMVVEDPVYDLEKVVFCQSQPVYDGTSWTMVRDPRTALAKDCVSLKPWHSAKGFESWIKGVGMSGTSLAGGMPIYDAFYTSFVRAGGGRQPKTLSMEDGGLYWQSRGMKRRGLAVTDEARHSFWLAFGIPADMQIQLEEHYSHTTPVYTPPEDVGMAWPTWDYDYLEC